MSEQWKRQNGESAKAFEAFSLYREMGTKRSLRKVARQLGKSNALIERWSKKWKWVERIKCYDNDIAQNVYTQSTKAIEDMKDRHIKIAMQLQVKALTALQNFPSNAMSAHDILSFIMEATKMECDNRGIHVNKNKNSGS